MNSLIATFLVFVTLTLAAVPVTAQGWPKSESLDGQSTFNSPTGPKYEFHSGLSMGAGGLPPYTWNEASVNLGAGITVGTFSSFSNAPPGTLSSIYSLGLNSTGVPHIGLGGMSNIVPNNVSLTTNGPSSVGGRLSMDLGSGLSMNLIGGVTRDPRDQFYLGPRGALNWTPGGTTSSSVGGGLSMDLGRGQSLSISGTVSKNTVGGFGMGPCGGLAISLCR